MLNILFLSQIPVSKINTIWRHFKKHSRHINKFQTIHIKTINNLRVLAFQLHFLFFCTESKRGFNIVSFELFIVLNIEMLEK